VVKPFLLFSAVAERLFQLSSYSMNETIYNMMNGMVGLLIMSTFGIGSRIWLICPIPSVICLPYYLRVFTLFVVFFGS
jgi:hypothetical protein